MKVSEDQNTVTIEPVAAKELKFVSGEPCPECFFYEQAGCDESLCTSWSREDGKDGCFKEVAPCE
jgi:hypothetical protein